MSKPIRIVYLDDCEIDHRLLDSYLQLDDENSYTLTPCLTLEEALRALNSGTYDALIIDNKMPPFRSFLEPYEVIKRGTDFQGTTIVVSADTSVPELEPGNLPGDEWVIDKSELASQIRNGVLNTACRADSVLPTNR
ncbi:MAG: hypothetical protein AAF739_09910 [Pseudomonadota bacterium]